MAQQEGGWPLGLQLLNVRIGVVRTHNPSESVSSTTLLTDSPVSSTIYSSDFDDESITFGSLIGVSSILELTQRSTRRKTVNGSKGQRNCRTRPWLFSVCSKMSVDAGGASETQSLGYFLEAERKAAGRFCGRNQTPVSSNLLGVFGDL